MSMSNSGTSPEQNGLKSLLTKGVVSAVALAGTTAIPIIVQRSLQPASTPTASPTATVPASPTPAISPQPSPLPEAAQMQSAEVTHQAVDQNENNDRPRGKGKKKKND